MKKIISLLAAAALSLTSVTAFAAAATSSDTINVNFSADKTTIAPGEEVKISVEINANGNADVSFDTVAMFGVVYDSENFEYVGSESIGSFQIQDLTEDLSEIWFMDETNMSYTAGATCAVVKFKAKSDISDGEYSFTVSDSDEDTGFQQDILTPFLPSNNNVACRGVDVTVSSKSDDDTVKAETQTSGSVKVTYPEGYTGDKNLDGKYIVFKNVVLESAKVTKDTRFDITYNGTKKTFGATLFETLKITGDGTLDAGSYGFGVAFDTDVAPSAVTITPVGVAE